ncbi:hypothetical protein EDD18DRAFT_1392900, partial [Armillaria luteobubalina]
GKDFAATLFAELFGKKDHCLSCDLKFVKDAFLSMAKQESTADLVLKPEVLDTIFTALKLPGPSRTSAVKFLESICPIRSHSGANDPENKESKDGEYSKCSQNFRPMDREHGFKLEPLISRIVELARKSKDKELLSCIRKALEVFCNHERFQKQLLQKDVLETITRDINLETANMYYGHGVEAQVSGIKCLRRLVRYAKNIKELAKTENSAGKVWRRLEEIDIANEPDRARKDEGEYVIQLREGYVLVLFLCLIWILSYTLSSPPLPSTGHLLRKTVSRVAIEH